MTGLLAYLQANVKTNPDRAALIYGDHVSSWEDLWRESRRTAAALAKVVGPGDRVLLALNAQNYVAALLACIQIGAVAVPLTRRETTREVDGIRAELSPSLCIVDDDTAQIMKLPVDQRVLNWDGLPGDLEMQDVCLNQDLSAIIHFSSGSTGRPKPIPRSHRNLALEAGSVAHAITLGSEDVVLCTTPLQHSYAGGLMAACIRANATIAIIDGFKPSSIVEFAGRIGATILAGTPYLFCALGTLKQRAQIDLPRLRFGVVGGAFLPTSFVKAFSDKFGKPLIQEYGLSEGGIVSFNSLSHLSKPTSVGRPIAGVSLSIVTETGEVAPVGVTGELVVSREAMPTFYVNHEDETRRVFSGCSVRTGDLAYVDGDGDFFIVGRIKQMINVSGNKVSPAEVMEVIISSGLVEDAAITAIANSDLGEVVGALVVPKHAALEPQHLISEILQYSRRELAAHKVPRRLTLCAEMPRLPNGKVDFKTVRMLLEAQ